MMSARPLSDGEFGRFQKFILQAAGITLSASKKQLVSGRLAKRVAQHGCGSYGEYLDLIAGQASPGEAQIAIDLLTTNETYFFREPKHFELLRELAAAARARRQPMRVWSAACSSGEEVYSIAMVLDDCLGPGAWDVLGTDISTRVLERARAGHYPTERTRHIPPHYLKKYCLRGLGAQQGTLLVDRALRDRVRFAQVNLNDTLPPQLGPFDAVFLRNVMIYFSADTKRAVVGRVLAALKPGGHFCIGHSESLNDITTAVALVSPSVYRKPS